MTLQIQAGKFYRTRDGRRVGPMNLVGGPYPWSIGNDISPSNLQCWTSTGAFWVHAIDHRDLIAEWTGEPSLVTHEAAPQSNATPIDLSKILVGDRVRLGGEFEVVDVANGGAILNFPVFGTRWMPLDVMAEHIPAKQPIEVGDVVSLAGSIHGKVLAIENGKAWVTVAGTQAYPHALNNLTRIDNPDRSVSL